MIKKLNSNHKKPSRVVILGSGGFIGSEIEDLLVKEGVQVLSLPSVALDLLSKDASLLLQNILVPDDVLIFVAAKAPCKDLEMFQQNIQMAKSVCEVLKLKPISQIIYISSDAVYKDSSNLISEKSCAEPQSLHGAMHIAREIALQNSTSSPLLIVRPTLVYGLNDTHNGYGPNRFIRLALNKSEIVLFGNGEELRDHIAVQDLARLVHQAILYRVEGVINAVSGDVVSFKEVAEYISSKFKNQVKVSSSLRQGIIPHNGYRAFDNSCLIENFPTISFQSWRIGLSHLCEEILH